MQKSSKRLGPHVLAVLLLFLPACSTASAELWPTEEPAQPTIIDVRLVPRPSGDRSGSSLVDDETYEAIAQAFAAAPGSRVRVYGPTCPPVLVLDETAPALPTRPRAVPRHVEREAACLVDRLRDVNDDGSPRRHGMCVAEAITLAAAADAVPDADDIHLVVLGSMIEESRFARLARGRLPTARVLSRRAGAQRLLPPGSLAGIRVHVAAHGPTTGMSFGRAQAVGELWLALFERAGAHDVMVTSGAPVLDDGVANDAEEEAP